MRFRLSGRVGCSQWFAWFPVPVMPYRERLWVWLEWVERERDVIDGGITGYHYRLSPGDTDGANE